jgi:hypothetical protein
MIRTRRGIALGFAESFQFGQDLIEPLTLNELPASRIFAPRCCRCKSISLWPVKNRSQR